MTSPVVQFYVHVHDYEPLTEDAKCNTCGARVAFTFMICVTTDPWPCAEASPHDPADGTTMTMTVCPRCHPEILEPEGE